MSVHVFIGEDDYKTSGAAKRIAGGGGLEVVDSILSTNEETRLRDIANVLSGYFTPPLFEPEKTTWWKNAAFLPQAGNSKNAPSEAVKAALEKFAEKLAASPMPPEQKLVITAPKLLASSRFAKTLRQIAADFEVFQALKPADAAKDALSFAADKAKEAGLSIDDAALRSFVSTVGTDSRTIASELEKLWAYADCGKRKATQADVAAISSPQMDADTPFWRITAGILERNAAKALSAISKFSSDDGFAVFMPSVLEKFFRQLVEIKAAVEAGKDEVPEGMNPYAYRANREGVEGWSMIELRMARMAMVKLREDAVSGGSVSGDRLVAEVARLCSRRRSGGRR